jgi:nucleoid DNA-binding protein
MTRSEVIRAIAIKTKLNQTQAREALDALVETLAMAASEGEDTTIAGFGKFLIRDRPEGIRTNPGTGEKVTVPERRTITFRASPAFKKRI